MNGNIIREEFILPFFGGYNSGVSDTNKAINGELKDVRTHLEETEPFWYKLETIRKYRDEIHEYFIPNWDGYGALPISKESFIEAIKFYSYMPNYWLQPEMIPLPSGEVAFEWYKNGNKQFSITFSGENVLVYAGIYGLMDTNHGTSYFDENIPDEIMDLVHKVYQ